MTLPIPVLGLIILFVLVIGAIYVRGLSQKWGILVPYIGMLLFSSMSLPLDWNSRINPTIWLPIQQNRSRLFLASGICAVMVVLMQTSRLRGKPASLSAWILVTVGFYAALLRFVHESPAQGIYSVFFAALTLVPLALVAPLVMDEIEDFVLLLRAIAITNAIWVGMVFLQILANPKYVIMGNEKRFAGLFANPQHAGVLVAFFSVVALWLLLNDQRKYRLMLLGLLGANTLFLIWSGSRTGLGMTVIGMSSVLYARAGKAILLLPFVAIVTYIGLKVVINVLGIDFGIDRLASTANTRDYAWWKLFTTGMENPLFGVGTLESERSENSWLFGFAAFGIGMLFLTLLLAITACWESFKTFRSRFSLPTECRPFSDLMVGMVMMYLAGAVLEGYMISRVNTTVCVFPLIAGAGAIIRKKSRYHKLDYSLETDYDEYSDYGEDHEADYTYDSPTA